MGWACHSSRGQGGQNSELWSLDPPTMQMQLIDPDFVSRYVARQYGVMDNAVGWLRLR